MLSTSHPSEKAPSRPEATENPLPGEPATVASLRTRIDELDARIVDLLAHRVRLARRIGQAKGGGGRPLLDPTREARIVRHAARRARASGIDAEGVRGVFWRLLALCRGAQERDQGKGS